MDCREVEEQEISERYLLNQLTEPEREEFEMHYFECGSCFLQLQTRLALQAELQLQPVMLGQARSASSHRIWIWAPALATIVLLFSAGIWWYSAQKRKASQQASSLSEASHDASVQALPPSTAAPSLEELARVEPPPYSVIVLRGAEDEGQEAFRRAMQFYLKGDYARAIPGLRAAAKANPRTPSFNFYLGACYLLTNQTDLAIVSLRQTVSLGAPAYSESAHFYLAKAYLQKKEIAAAENELQETVQLHGSLEVEAGEILRQLRK
jgi:TolA-binding protein